MNSINIEITENTQNVCKISARLVENGGVFAGFYGNWSLRREMTVRDGLCMSGCHQLTCLSLMLSAFGYNLGFENSLKIFFILLFNLKVTQLIITSSTEKKKCLSEWISVGLVRIFFHEKLLKLNLWK